MYFADEEEEVEQEEKFSISKKMMDNRTIMLFGEINQKVAREISGQLLLLDSISQDDIKLFVNSPGGHVESGDTIFDVIRFIKSKVKIIGTGWVASAGALIYSSVPKEDRYSLTNTRYMIHQPLGGIRGQASDIAIAAEEILKMRKRLNETFAAQTGQPLEKIEKDTERNYWMGAQEAFDYGLVGKIIHSIDEL